MEGNNTNALLDVRDLTFSFRTYAGEVQAVRGVSFTLEKGRSLGLVGESGCGKSVTAKSIIRLNPEKPKGLYKKGEVLFNGRDLLKISDREMQKVRAQEIRMIFQDPMTSLNPTMTIGKQIVEGIVKYGDKTKEEAKKIALDTLALAGIPSPEDRFKQYPHEFSGGMRQRVMIAMALLCDPELLIADEPTTALDVTIQAQILDLLRSINEKLGTSIILITHDLGVVASMVDTVVVMYCGHIVEKADVYTIFQKPLHPYTEGLLRSIPRMDDTQGELQTIEGSVPSIYNMPEGCAFHNRCAQCRAICQKQLPPVVQAEEGHLVQCWKYTDQWAQAQPAQAGEGGSEHV